MRPPPLLSLFLVGLALAIASHPLKAGDTFWHLSVGRWVLETGEVPFEDPFTFSRQGERWTPHSTLFAVGLAGAERSGGLAGLRVLRGLQPLLAGLALAALLLRRTGGSYRAATWLVVAVSLGTLQLARLRPYWIPMVLLPLAWVLVERARDPREAAPPAWLYFLLALPWANAHATVMLAIALPGFALVLDPPEDATRRWRLLQFSLVAALASLLTVNGLDLWRYWLAHFPTPFFAGFIREWEPPGWEPDAWVANLLLIGLWALALSRPRGRARYEWAWAALWTWKYVQFYRFMSLALMGAAVVAAPAAAAWMGDAEDPGPGELARDRRWSGAFTGAALALALAGAVPLSGPHLVDEHMPAAALDEFLAKTEARRIFHRYYWGAYIPWASKNRILAYIDGRNDLFGPEGIEAYRAILLGSPGWQEAFRAGDFDAVVLQSDAACLPRIRALGGWVERPFPHDAVTLLVREGTPAAGAGPSGKDPVDPEDP